MANINTIRATMRAMLRNGDCIDRTCDEVNMTQLAENTCNQLDAYIGEDFTIPEEFFEVAADLATEYENNKNGH